MSDKRRAVDKDSSDSLDLNESSMIELKPARKRPRMEDHEDIEVLGQTREGDIETMPVELDASINPMAVDIDVDSANIIGVDVSLVEGDVNRGVDAGYLIKDSHITVEDNEVN